MANDKIVVLEGPSLNRQIVLNGTSAVIGRKTPDNEPEISIDDVRVSRQHATLNLRDGKWYVEKGRGMNLLLNGEEITQPTLFSMGDTITVFDYKLRMQNNQNGLRKILLLLLLLVVGFFSYVLLGQNVNNSASTQPSLSKRVVYKEQEDAAELLQKAIDLKTERKAFPENFDRAIAVFEKIVLGNYADSMKKTAQAERNALVQERDSILEEVFLACRILKREGRGSDAVKVASEALRYVGKPEEPLRRDLLSIIEGKR